MWVKKSEWEKMRKAINELHGDYQELYEKHRNLFFVVKTLDELHLKTKWNSGESYGQTRNHNFSKVDTNAISDLTLEELARYVIDGTPIKRKQEIEVEFN